MSDLPTIDEAFPPPTVEEAFPPPTQTFVGDEFSLDGKFWDSVIDSSHPGYILHRFAQGAAQGWGAQQNLGFTDKELKDMRSGGLFNDWEAGQRSIIKSFNESLLRSTAIGADLMFRRLPGAVIGGLGEVIPPIRALAEAFPAGHFTGFPIPVRPPPYAPMLDDAAEVGILPRETARQSLAPRGEETATEQVVQPPLTITAEDAPDIHGLARTITPETFSKYDALAQQKETFRTWIDELTETRRQEPEAVALQKRIDETLGKVRGVEERLTKRAATRLESDRAALDAFMRTDTEAMRDVRQSMMTVDEQMRDLAPDVSAAYRDARDQMPPPEPVIPAPEPTPPAIEPAPTADIIPLHPDTTVEPRAELDPTILSLAQRRPTIAADVTSRLINAGRPAEEARAAATLWQAYYETRAARLGIPARQLFDEDAPRIRTGEGTQRGRFTFGDPRNIITLFHNADASTFMHETGHQWLEDLVRDARRDGAPADLVTDMDTVREWLGATEERLTRAQHEKFARGLERYLMEGQAPSTRLAKVFEQFKKWLTQIYQTVARLRSPINDNIRGVYDRLLSRPRDEPVITAEREGARTFDEDHMIAARETPAAEAESKANEIRAERDRVALLLKEEIDNARREARRGKARDGIPTEQVAGERTVAGGEGAVEADAPIRTGREPPAGESEAPARADATFGTSDRDLVDKAGNIRVDNLNLPEDVTTAIHQAAAARGGFVAERRGTMTDAEVFSLAEDMGLDPRKLNRRKVGQAFNAEEIVYARRLLIDASTKVRDAAGKAAEGDTKSLMEYGKARERLLMVQGQVAGITAEAGRALRAFRSLSGEGGEALAPELFQRAIGTLRELQQEAMLVRELDTPQKISKFVREKSEPGWKDYIIEAWLNLGLLSGPFTHLVNIVGNTSVMLGSVVEQASAAAVSTLRGTRAVSYGSVMDRMAGIYQGSIEGVIAAGRALWDESVVEQASHTLEQRRFQAIPSKTVNIGGIDWNIGGAQVRLPGRFLTAEDEFFRAVAMRQELNVVARQQARLEGLADDAFDARIVDLLSHPTDEMLAAAREYAAYQTFTKELGPLGRAVQDFANSHPAAKFIVPFVRTPVNLFKYAVERTPAGYAMKEVRQNLSGRNGEVARDTQIARMVLGTMTMSAFGYLAFNGLASGGGPTNPAQQATLRRTGWQPYSINIGGTGFHTPALIQSQP
jgi:hypothetical protein